MCLTLREIKKTEFCSKTESSRTLANVSFRRLICSSQRYFEDTCISKPQIGKPFLLYWLEMLTRNIFSIWAYPCCSLKHRRFVLAQGFNWLNRHVGSSCHLCSLCAVLKYSSISHTRQQMADQRPQPWLTATAARLGAENRVCSWGAVIWLGSPGRLMACLLPLLCFLCVLPNV